MFELTKDVIDDIIFAMEDQDDAWQIDIEKGSLVARDLACGDGDPVVVAPRVETVSIPAWSPRDGFKLMETFASGVRLAAARRVLMEALGHGRGVFKSFKEGLSAYPEVDRAFREKKSRVMGARIQEWYDDLREAAGLERLGSPPEDASDLVESDLGHSAGLASTARPFMLALLGRLETELAAAMPAPILAQASRALHARLAEEDWIGVWVDDGEGGTIAGATGRREAGPGYVLGRIFFVAVDADFRRQGIARVLVDRLSEELADGQGSPILVDSALLHPDFEEGLLDSGFSSLGTRAWRAN